MRHKHCLHCSARSPQHTVYRYHQYRRSQWDTAHTQCLNLLAECRRYSDCRTLPCQRILGCMVHRLCCLHLVIHHLSKLSKCHPSQHYQQHIRGKHLALGCLARSQQNTVRRSLPYQQIQQGTPRTQCCSTPADCRHHSACMSLLCQSIPQRMGHKPCRRRLARSRPHRQCKCMPMCHMNHPRQHSPECNRRTPCCRRSAVTQRDTQSMCRLIRQTVHCKAHMRSDPRAARFRPGSVHMCLLS